MNTLAKIYRAIVNHLTKIIGTVGTLIASIAAIDPEPIRAAVAVYLTGPAVKWSFAGLFLLVVLRGWYTGRKGEKLKNEEPPPK